MKTKEKEMLYGLQAKICSAMAHPVRLHVLDLIFEGEKNSRELLDVLKIPKANLSQHVAILKEAGLVKARKEGTCVYLSLAIPKIRNACMLVQTILIDKIKKDEKSNSKILRKLESKVGQK